MTVKFQIDTAGTLLTGLVSYFKLGDVNDFYGANHLSNMGATPFPAGKVNNCAQFNGSSNGLTLGAPISVATDNISAFMWVNLANTWQHGHFFVNGNTGNSGYALGVGSTNTNNYGNNLILHLPGVIFISFGIAIGTGWKLVGITRTSGTWRGYVNNTVGGSTGTTNPATPNSSFSMSYYQPWGTYFTGGLDEFGFWNKALSAQERTDLYNGGAGQTMVPAINSYTLAMDVGPFSMTGTAILLPRSAISLGLSPAAFSMVGSPLFIWKAHPSIVMDSGAFALTGTALSIKRPTSYMRMDPGAFAMNGTPMFPHYGWYRGVSTLNYQFPKQRRQF